MRFLFLVLFICAPVGAFDISAGLKKIADDVKYEVSSLELFVSPIIPGGKFGISPNLGNLWRKATGKLECTWTECKIVISKPLIARYVDTVLLPDDEELREFNSDPRPDPYYKHNLRLMKAERRGVLIEELYEKYHIK